MTQSYSDQWSAYEKQRRIHMGITETLELLNEFKTLLQKLRSGLADKKLNILEIFGLVKQLMDVAGQMQFDLIWKEVRDIDSQEGVEIADIILECKNIIVAIYRIYFPVEAPTEG